MQDGIPSNPAENYGRGGMTTTWHPCKILFGSTLSNDTGEFFEKAAQNKVASPWQVQAGQPWNSQ